MPDLKTSLKTKSVQWVLAAAGGGAGLVLGIAALEALKTRPEFVPQLVSGGGLWFSALVVGMVMFRTEMRNFNATQQRSVVAQERLAENVGGLVEKIGLRDEAMERRAREQELTLNHLARQVDMTLEHIVELRRERGLN